MNETFIRDRRGQGMDGTLIKSCQRSAKQPQNWGGGWNDIENEKKKSMIRVGPKTRSLEIVDVLRRHQLSMRVPTIWM